MKLNSVLSRGRTLQFRVLAAFLVLVFLTGGASRIDVLSLALLRPVAVLLCLLSLFTLRREHLQGAGWMIGGLLAMAGLVLLHLIPLPPAIWHNLPGRDAIVAADTYLGNSDHWRPLAIAPMNAWHALSSLSVPAAVLLLGLQLQVQERMMLLYIVIGLACLSGLTGILQLLGGSDGPLYLYNVTNRGAAVGLFANRNHAALLLASILPMLAVLSTVSQSTRDRHRLSMLIAVGLGAIIVPLLLVNGSRSGLILGGIGLISALLLYRRRPSGPVPRKSGARIEIRVEHLLVSAIVVALGLVTIVLSRADSIDRLLATTTSDDIRGEFWSISWDVARAHFPLGAGAGSFVEAYQISEPNYILHGNYLNRAHNDWLETLVTFGAPGLAILTLFAFSVLWRIFSVWRKTTDQSAERVFARLGAILIIMTALASVADYPLRTPIFMALFVIFVLWLMLPINRVQAPIEQTSRSVLAGQQPSPAKSWSRMRIARAIGFSVAAAALSWFSFSLAMSGIARQRAPSVALSFVPSEPYAMARRAEQMLGRKPRPDLERVEYLASVALRNQLVNPRALRLLGTAALIRGDEARANKLLAFSQEFSRRDLYTQILLIETNIKRGDAVAVFRHYDISLRTHPASGEKAYPRLTAALHLPTIQQGVLPYLASGKGWAVEMVDHAISHHKNLGAVTQMMLATKARPDREKQVEQKVRLLSALVTEKLYDEVEELFITIPGARREKLQSADLTADDARRTFGPIAWVPVERPDAGSSISANARQRTAMMSVYASAAVAAPVAQRILFLTPGRYRIAARIEKMAGADDSGVRWQMRCVADPAQPLLWAGSTGKILTVPTGCRVQRLEIVVVGGADQTGFDGEISDISLSRQ